MSRDKYNYWEFIGEKIHEDENGRYQIKSVRREIRCGCHPETCTHERRKTTVSFEEKIYINE